MEREARAAADGKQARNMVRMLLAASAADPEEKQRQLHRLIRNKVRHPGRPTSQSCKKTHVLNARKLDIGPRNAPERGTIRNPVTYWWQKQGKKVT